MRQIEFHQFALVFGLRLIEQGAELGAQGFDPDLQGFGLFCIDFINCATSAGEPFRKFSGTCASSGSGVWFESSFIIRREAPVSKTSPCLARGNGPTV